MHQIRPFLAHLLECLSATCTVQGGEEVSGRSLCVERVWSSNSSGGGGPPKLSLDPLVIDSYMLSLPCVGIHGRKHCTQFIHTFQRYENSMACPLDPSTCQ